MDEKWTALSGWTVGIAALVVVFGAGFVTGHMLPEHHYERFGNSLKLFDTSTGHICDTQLGSPPDPFAVYGGHAISPSTGSDPYAQYKVDPNTPKDANGFPIVKEPPKNADGYPIVQATPTPNNPLGFPESPNQSSNLPPGFVLDKPTTPPSSGGGTPSVTFPPCNQ